MVIPKYNISILTFYGNNYFLLPTCFLFLLLIVSFLLKNAFNVFYCSHKMFYPCKNISLIVANVLNLKLISLACVSNTEINLQIKCAFKIVLYVVILKIEMLLW